MSPRFSDYGRIVKPVSSKFTTSRSRACGSDGARLYLAPHRPGDGALCLLLRCATNDTLAQDAAGAAVHGDHWPEHFMSLCLLDPNDSDNYILLSPPDHSTVCLLIERSVKPRGFLHSYSFRACRALLIPSLRLPPARIRLIVLD
jgi:hypothetical protein